MTFELPPIAGPQRPVALNKFKASLPFWPYPSTEPLDGFFSHSPEKPSSETFPLAGSLIFTLTF